MPRGLILPPDAPEEAQEWWIDTMKEVVETDEWQSYLDENYLRRGRPLGRGLHGVPRRDQAPRSRSSSTSWEHCDHDGHLRHEQQREVTRRLPGWVRPKVGLPGCCSWWCSRSTPRWPSTWSGGPRPAGSAPASSRGSWAARTRADPRRAGRSAAFAVRRGRDRRAGGRGRRRRPRQAPEDAGAVLVVSVFLVATLVALGAIIASTVFMLAGAQPAQPGPARAQRGAQPDPAPGPVPAASRRCSTPGCPRASCPGSDRPT